MDEVPRTDKGVEEVERTVDATAVEVPSTDNGVDEVPRTDSGEEEVSCTNSRGADR